MNDVLADPAGFVAGFEAWTDAHLGEWFDAQVALDREQEQRLHALAQERRLPLPSPALQRALALRAPAKQDHEVAGTLARMMNLLLLPRVAADRASPSSCGCRGKRSKCGRARHGGSLRNGW